MCGWRPASIPTGHSWAKSQGRRISSRSFQRALSFSCEPCRTVSHCPGATRPLVRRRLIWFPAHRIRLTGYGFICLRLYGVAVMSCRSPVGNAPHILLRLVSSYSPAWDTPRDTLVFRGVTLSSGAFFNAGLDVCCTSERCRPTLARYP